MLALITTHEYKSQTDVFSLPNKSEILTISIDAAINEAHKSGNSQFWIDFSKTRFIDSISKAKCTPSSRFLTEINSDSLFKFDTTWTKHGHLAQGLFVIGDISRFGNTIKVNASLVYALEAGKGFEITLTKIGEHYRITDQRITWISFLDDIVYNHKTSSYIQDDVVRSKSRLENIKLSQYIHSGSNFSSINNRLFWSI